MSEIAAGLTPEELQRPVPACPGWTVHDVVAHLVGVCTDVVHGKLDGITTAAWADAQARERQDRTVVQLLDEWSAAASVLEAGADRFPPPLGTLWVLDLTAHEHDVRGATGRAGARDSPAVLLATDWLVKKGLHSRLVELDAGAVVVKTADMSWVAGDRRSPPAEPAPTVTCSTFELFRALAGRRSPGQIAALDWSVDPTPFLPAFQFGTFTTRTTDLDE